MLRFGRRTFHLHQGDKSLLQDVFRLTVAQAQGATVENQSRSFGVVQRFTPMCLGNFVHFFNR